MRYLTLALLLFPGIGLAAEWKEIPVEDLAGGKTLSGVWTVEDGALVGRATDEMAWILFEGDYADFEVEFEFETPTPSNGGLQFRSHWLPVLPLVEGVAPLEGPHQMYGYQANIETRERGATGRLVDENGRGALAQASAEATRTVKQKTSNTLRVVAQGNVIEIYLNGALANRTEDEAFIQGAFALQVMPNQPGQPPAEILHRNFRIKDLGRQGAWRALFDGASLAGWKEYGAEKWTVENGEILGSSGPKQSEGYLATEEHFKDFRVRGSFKMLGDGNYGLFYHSTITLREDGYPVISGVQGEVEPRYPSATGWLYESYKRGWIEQPDPNTLGALALRPGAWNTIEIRAQGNHVTTWVNGVRAVDIHDDDQQLFEGSFALQLHTGGVEGILWRGLYVAE